MNIIRSTKSDNVWKSRIILFGLLVALFISAFHLFYMQAMGEVTSDLSIHIRDAIMPNVTGYSLCTVLLRISYIIAGEGGCAFCLAAVVTVTPFAIAAMLRELLRGYKNTEINRYCFREILLFSIPFVCLGSIFIPYLYPYFYLDPNFSGPGSPFSFVTQPWHNSTYLLMRPLGLMTIKSYLAIKKKYLQQGISGKEWIAFLIWLSLTNTAKPNFFLAFAPAMLCSIIYDFCRQKGKNWQTMVVFGLAVLCSMPILFFQLGIVYFQTTQASSGVIFFNLIAELLSNHVLIPCMFSGLLFPGIITYCCYRKKQLSYALIFSWLMFIISFGEAMFLKETGYREDHGNFGWGMPFFSLVLVSTCFVEYIELRRKYHRLKWVFIGIPLMLMFLTGFVYYVSLVGGSPYFR